MTGERRAGASRARESRGSDRGSRRSEGGKGERTRQAILDAAIGRFGREGYQATSVAAIARDAGVGGTVTYAYFPNKEGLFLAAVDDDAAGVIEDGLASIFDTDPMPMGGELRRRLMTTLIDSVGRHPLARRLLAGLEPEVTDRVIQMPALEELRKVICERMRADQLLGRVRPDVDPVRMANGVVAITLSLLMTAVQLGPKVAAIYEDDIGAVFEAAIERAP